MPHAPAFAPAANPFSAARAANQLASPSSLRRRRPLHVATVACAAPPRRKVTVKFKPEDVNVEAQVGECLGDVAARGGVSLLITCSAGDCGSCEIEQVFESGDRWIVRPCIMPVPEPEEDADDTVTYLTYPDYTY